MVTKSTTSKTDIHQKLKIVKAQKQKQSKVSLDDSKLEKPKRTKT